MSVSNLTMNARTLSELPLPALVVPGLFLFVLSLAHTTTLRMITLACACLVRGWC